jgi:hypothetical protein
MHGSCTGGEQRGALTLGSSPCSTASSCAGVMATGRSSCGPAVSPSVDTNCAITLALLSSGMKAVVPRSREYAIAGGPPPPRWK